MARYPPCSLMGLPVELRIAIFEFTLADEHIRLRHHQSRNLQYITTQWNGTALLAINSQTRREAQPIYLDQSTFEFCDGFTAQDLHRWIEVLGDENIHKLRALVFHCIGRCSMYGLQPDTDYCHRSATLTKDDLAQSPKRPRLCDVDMCSNRAFGCLEMGKAALDKCVQGMSLSSSSQGDEEHRLYAGDLLELFMVMTEDQSSSAA